MRDEEDMLSHEYADSEFCALSVPKARTINSIVDSSVFVITV